MASGFELIAASGRGDLMESKRLIESCHVNLEEHDAMGQTPLHVRASAAAFVTRPLEDAKRYEHACSWRPTTGTQI